MSGKWRRMYALTAQKIDCLHATETQMARASSPENRRRGGWLWSLEFDTLGTNVRTISSKFSVASVCNRRWWNTFIVESVRCLYAVSSCYHECIQQPDTTLRLHLAPEEAVLRYASSSSVRPSARPSVACRHNSTNLGCHRQTMRRSASRQTCCKQRWNSVW